jgi:DNA mismatch endonuclease (patch repair protein)
MTDIYPKEKRSEIMSSVRSRGNRATELVMLKLLRRQRIKGWRRHLAILGAPDFAFPKERVAVFLDGCFWHGCPIHFKLPKSNCDFWEKRIATNRRRDRRITKELRACGWTVIRIWQHDIKRSPAQCIRKLQKALNVSWKCDQNYLRFED